MLVAVRSDAQTFVKTLVEQMYEDMDRLETQIVRNQQEDPLVVPPLLSIQNKLREFLRLVRRVCDPRRTTVTKRQRVRVNVKGRVYSL